MDFIRKYETVTKKEFIDYYEKFRQDVMMRIINHDYTDINAEDFLRTIKLYPVQATSSLSTLLKGSNDMKVFVVDIDPTYEVFVIDARDISLKNNELYPGADALVIWSNMDDDDGNTRRTAFIVLGRDNPAYKDENVQHLIEHELTHVMMDYFQYSKKWKDGMLESMTKDENEFFADFIPIYITKNKKDLFTKYIEFATKWFKDKVIDKHREFIKKIVLYYNTWGKYPR